MNTNILDYRAGRISMTTTKGQRSPMPARRLRTITQLVRFCGLSSEHLTPLQVAMSLANLGKDYRYAGMPHGKKHTAFLARERVKAEQKRKWDEEQARRVAITPIEQIAAVHESDRAEKENIQKTKRNTAKKAAPVIKVVKKPAVKKKAAPKK